MLGSNSVLGGVAFSVIGGGLGALLFASTSVTTGYRDDSYQALRTASRVIELAPSSDPNDGNQLSLYVADYGADQVNDGHIYEIHLGPDWIF